MPQLYRLWDGPNDGQHVSSDMASRDGHIRIVEIVGEPLKLMLTPGKLRTGIYRVVDDVSVIGSAQWVGWEDEIKPGPSIFFGKSDDEILEMIDAASKPPAAQ